MPAGDDVRAGQFTSALCWVESAEQRKKITAGGKRRPNGGDTLPASRFGVGSVRDEPTTETDGYSQDEERQSEIRNE